MTNLTYVQADLRDGTISSILGTRVIDGIPGWTLVSYPDGTHWVYAPMHVQMYTGEIARQV